MIELPAMVVPVPGAWAVCNAEGEVCVCSDRRDAEIILQALEKLAEPRRAE